MTTTTETPAPLYVSTPDGLAVVKWVVRADNWGSYTTPSWADALHVAGTAIESGDAVVVELRINVVPERIRTGKFAAHWASRPVAFHVENATAIVEGN